MLQSKIKKREIAEPNRGAEVPQSPGHTPLGEPNATNGFREAVRAERVLIDRVISGDSAAWTQLYQLCHRPLCAAIRRMMPAWPVDANLVDELAARVWYSVVKDDARLLDRFDPACDGRLTTYLTLIAKDEASRMFRSERRRRRREARCAEGSPTSARASWDAASIRVSLAEFERTLTAAEKSLYDEIVRTPEREPGDNRQGGSEWSDPAQAVHRSKANLWQLRHRLRAKLIHFLAS